MHLLLYSGPNLREVSPENLVISWVNLHVGFFQTTAGTVNL